MFTENELLVLASWNRKQLYAFAKGKSVMAMLDFRRAVQKALASYSKRHRTFDEVKGNVLRLMAKVESWCRDAYFTDMRVRLISERPELATRPHAVKEILKNTWEKLVVTKSY